MNIRAELLNIAIKHDLYDVQLSILSKNNIIIDETCITNRKNDMWTITPESKFRIASISKLFTSIVILKLEEMGMLDITKPVDNYLDFRVINPHFKSKDITIKMLLTHTSSIVDSIHYSDHYPFHIRELFEIGGKFNSDDLYLSINSVYIEPGMKFAYSNIGYMLLGTLIEQVTNKRFDTVIDELIVNPLSIDGTFNIHDLEPSKYNQIHPPMRKVDGLWIAQTDNFEQSRGKYANYKVGTNASSLGPQGGFRTNSREIIKLLDIFSLHNDVVLSPKTVKKMMKPLIYEHNNSDKYDYCYMRGLGTGIIVENDTKKIKYIGHLGDAYGLNAMLYYSPTKNYGFSFISVGKSNELTNYNLSQSILLNFQKEILELVDNIIDNL